MSFKKNKARLLTEMVFLSIVIAIVVFAAKDRLYGIIKIFSNNNEIPDLSNGNIYIPDSLHYYTSDLVYDSSDLDESEILKADDNSNVEDDPILMSESSFLIHLNSIINKEYSVLFYHYNDYNGDGNCELFAVVGKKDLQDSRISDFEVWFVSQKESRLVEKCSFVVLSIPEPFTVDDKVFIVLQNSWTSGAYAYFWGVNKDGNPYQPNLSGKCESFLLNQYNEIESIILTSGAYEDESGSPYGRNIKPYYFYWNGINFKEYGGIQISLDDFYKIKGAKEIINQIYEEFGKIEENGVKLYSEIEILEIYYRENGIINVNFKCDLSSEVDHTYKVKNCYITLRYINGNLKIEFSEIYNSIYGEGFYEPASVSSIASYPKYFDIAN